MSRVETSIGIAAPVAVVWEIALDPHRLGEWVTIHRNLRSAPDRPLRKDDRIRQGMAIRGAPFDVTWEVTEIDPPHRAVWTGRGPARSVAITEYELVDEGGTTLFRYANEFNPPGGLVGRVAASVLVGGIPEDEAKASLRRLKELAESSR